ncbi:hypothetical protein FQN60_002858 [Etheostoma spectabile]|uniref:Uncharacterized protein n=1 Tax=Etheostoma spectabile TaxID=54343 RepID=A0A5J5CHS7_9PERO|nr:hypothetical protein FQN60_002858 [Etheostoma spectabile]
MEEDETAGGDDVPRPMSPLNSCTSAWLPILHPTPLQAEPRDRWADMGTDTPGAPSQPASQPTSQSVLERRPGMMLQTTCCEQQSPDRSRESVPAVGVPCRPTSGRAQDRRGSRVEQRLGLFTQLWGSPGLGEREDVFRVSLIMAASEEINRQGPAGMLQLLPLMGGRDRGVGDGVEG